MSNPSKKDASVTIHWVWVHVFEKEKAHEPMFILRDRAAKKDFSFDKDGVKTHELKNVSLLEHYHQEYFCKAESWDKLMKLAKNEWKKEKTKASDPKHSLRQGIKFMSHFVNEAIDQKVIWDIEERGKGILDIIGSTMFDHDKKEVNHLDCLAQLPKLRLKLDAHNNQPDNELGDKKEDDTRRELKNYENKPGMKELRLLIHDHKEHLRLNDRPSRILNKRSSSQRRGA